MTLPKRPSARVGPRLAGPSVTQSSFRLTLFRDIAVEHHKVWTIDDIIAAGEVSCWYGFPGSAKSALVGDAAAHVAAGIPWFGRQVGQGGVTDHVWTVRELVEAALNGTLAAGRMVA